MIDYEKISNSINFYQIRGFQRIETPWTVTKPISDITKPNWASDHTIMEKNKVLVASAEQGFLYLYNKGFLPEGKFQSVGPCFRDDVFGVYHTKYFIKNELINTESVNKNNLIRMIEDALLFFKQYTPHKLKVIKTSNDSYDIELCGIELGSYGIRQSTFIDWIYGTGIAEPRFTRALS